MITGASLHPHQRAHSCRADRIAYRSRREIHVEREQGGDHGQWAQADDCYSGHFSQFHAKATEVEPGNAGGLEAAVRQNNDQASVASRLLPGERQPVRALRRSPEVLCSGGAAAARLAHNQEVKGASPFPATISVSCVSAALSGRLSSLDSGRLPVRAGAGLFLREGVARAASRQLSPFRRAGTSRRVFSVSREAALRGRASSFASRPLGNSFRHRVNSVVRVCFVAETDTTRRIWRDVPKICEKFRVRSTGAGSERVCV